MRDDRAGTLSLIDKEDRQRRRLDDHATPGTHLISEDFLQTRVNPTFAHLVQHIRGGQLDALLVRRENVRLLRPGGEHDETPLLEPAAHSLLGGLFAARRDRGIFRHDEASSLSRGDDDAPDQQPVIVSFTFDDSDLAARYDATLAASLGIRDKSSGASPWF
ncbi:MAG: hypothetical protein LBM23_02320 [Propionibacteriaceae bacterium]|nr:hypothetical protein [Propionibacteriaceae bacterium]